MLNTMKFRVACAASCLALLAGCSSQRTGIVELYEVRFSGDNNWGAIEPATSREPPPQGDRLRRASSVIKKGEPLLITLERAMVFQFQESFDNGEIAVVSEVEVVGRDGIVRDEKPRLVAYSPNLRQGAHLNFFDIPIYGPATWSGELIRVRLSFIEMDSAENEMMSQYLKLAAAGVAAAQPQYAPVAAVAESVGAFLLSQNSDDVEFQPEFVLYDDKDRDLNVPTLRAGKFVAIKREWGRYVRPFYDNDDSVEVDKMFPQASRSAWLDGGGTLLGGLGWIANWLIPDALGFQFVTDVLWDSSVETDFLYYEDAKLKYDAAPKEFDEFWLPFGTMAVRNGSRGSGGAAAPNAPGRVTSHPFQARTYAILNVSKSVDALPVNVLAQVDALQKEAFEAVRSLTSGQRDQFESYLAAITSSIEAYRLAEEFRELSADPQTNAAKLKGIRERLEILKGRVAYRDKAIDEMISSALASIGSPKPPTPPAKSAVASAGKVSLAWLPPDEVDAKTLGYQIRRCANEAGEQSCASNTQLEAFYVPAAPAAGAAPAANAPIGYEDKGVKSGSSYQYFIHALTKDGKMSGKPLITEWVTAP